MKLATEFLRLPLTFDAERLRAEVEAIPARAWRRHPQGHAGNTALPLIARGGDPADDGVTGAMDETPELAGLEYVRQVLASFDTVLGRARLMRIEGGAQATRHVDVNAYWAERVRIHVPIATSPAIAFTCGDAAVHMAPGEAWIFDAFRRHNVVNPTGDPRIHLVADTVGSAAFWAMAGGRAGTEPRAVAHRPGHRPTLATEQLAPAPVATPWALAMRRDELLASVAADADPALVAGLRAALDDLVSDWRALWARAGDAAHLHAAYDAALARADRALTPLAGRVALDNETDAVELAGHWLLHAARTAVPPVAAPPRPARPAPALERPVFVVGAPRSGTTMVFEALAAARDAWTIGGESHAVIESIPALAPAARGWDSNRLEALDARPPAVAALRAAFAERLRDRDGRPPAPGTAVRLVEKTPKNALRIPFLAAAFPDALFLHVHRAPADTVASMVEAWASGRYVTYPDLPGWPGPPWSLLLTPGWRALAGQPPAEIAAAQWEATVRTMLDDLDRLDPARVLTVDAAEIAASPADELRRIAAFAGLEMDREPADPLPPSRHTLTPPRPGKWRAQAEALEPLLPRLAPLDDRARRRPTAAPRASVPPLASVATDGVRAALERAGGALVASTYQAGKLIVLRDGERGLNTHFRDLELPMGVAHDGDRLAVGTATGVVEYRDAPAVTPRLDAALGRHDACFLPRRTHLTGDVRVHDIAYAGDELWLVATRFSCLATLDADHSFVPRWRPPFVSAIVAEDRCHLNGLAVVDDRPAFVTALGATDTPGGWRDRRAEGGVLVDVDSGETVLSGLSMPHSPRWADGRLWLLESGRGTLAVADLAAGTWETVAELPGFTRGLAIAGGLAFVGLSQVREATTFGGLPLTARAAERHCGVWVVDLATGAVAGFVRFEDAVQELFDVAILPGRHFPEIAEPGGDVARLAYVVPSAALDASGA